MVIRPAATGLAILGAALVTAACGDGGPSSTGVQAVRDTLAGGAVRVRYGPLPPGGATVLETELAIGVLDGPEEYTLGDVRSVDALADGTILVLDSQGPVIRAYDPDGTFSHVVARSGEGPGEILRANGMVVRGDTAVWVHDHGQWKMVGLRPDGSGEVARVDLPVLSYGYTWSGQVDEAGRVWKFATHGRETAPGERPTGLQEAEFRAYGKFIAPGAASPDSLFLYRAESRTFIQAMGETRRRYWGIPFDHRPVAAVDPAGHTWIGDPVAYRLVRLDLSGDTMLVVEADVDPLPVTAEDRDLWRSERLERMPDDARTLDDLLELAPATRSVIAGLTFDDRGRVWVERTVPAGERPLYDVFTPDGSLEARYRLGFDKAEYLPLWIRGDRAYAVVTDSLDVPRVVRAPVPPA